MKSREREKDIILKADRTVLQRLITAYGAGRSVDMQMVMQHELVTVPIALAEMNGQLRNGARSILADVLLSGINCTESIEVEGSSCLIIDGNALIVAIGSHKMPKRMEILLMSSWVLSCIMAELVNKYMLNLTDIGQILSSQLQEKNAKDI